MKIAMWSGPRNLSTAMMYSFASRSDCAVWDEPYYAPHLAATGRDHPMRDKIVFHHETDPEKVAALCAGEPPSGKRHFYMKHMPHHMLETFPLDWAETCVNVHLLRHPARVIASYMEKVEDASIDDVGFAQQVRIYERLGGIVIDSFEIRKDPRQALEALCALIGIEFQVSMLGWKAGGRPEDGIWARHWYGAVHRSTGFAGPESALPELSGSARALELSVLPYYKAMMSDAQPLLK